MRIYTVHESPFWALAEKAVPGADVVLIAEGFCWPAALFTVLWAAWHRLWLVALAILGAGAALDAASALVPIGDAARTVLGLGGPAVHRLRGQRLAPLDVGATRLAHRRHRRRPLAE